LKFECLQTIIMVYMALFYTGNGDDGKAGLLGEGRLPKYHPRMEALGAIDEAMAALGVARAACCAPQTASLLIRIQHDLYLLMAEVAATPQNTACFHAIDNASVTWLETQIDTLNKTIRAPKEFVLPGDTPAGAVLALARTIVRRAERRLARLLDEGQEINPFLLSYLNRLSSMCFVLELLETQHAGLTSTLAKEIK